MAASRTTVGTENASRYLQQLCKHWSHRFAVEFTPAEGRIAFDQNTSVGLEATGSRLVVTIEAPGEADLPRLEKVVEEHIRRFAFREELAFEWIGEAQGKPAGA